MCVPQQYTILSEYAAGSSARRFRVPPVRRKESIPSPQLLYWKQADLSMNPDMITSGSDRISYGTAPIASGPARLRIALSRITARHRSTAERAQTVFSFPGIKKDKKTARPKA